MPHAVRGEGHLKPYLHFVDHHESTSLVTDLADC